MLKPVDELSPTELDIEIAEFKGAFGVVDYSKPEQNYGLLMELLESDHRMVTIDHIQDGEVILQLENTYEGNQVVMTGFCDTPAEAIKQAYVAYRREGRVEG